MTDSKTEATGSGRASVAAWLERMGLGGRIIGFGSVGFIFRLIRKALLACFFLAIIATGLTYFRDLPKYPFFHKIVAYEQRVEAPMLGALRRSWPTNFRGSDISRLMLFSAVCLLAVLFGVVGAGFTQQAAHLRGWRETLKEARHSTPGTGSSQAEVKLNRKDLLEIYAKTKKSLEEHKVHMAFLSIDVVNSTGMKAGEEPGIAERDFRHYKRMVVKVLTENKAVKSAWTPDGVMAGFGSVREAVRAAQGVVTGLAQFNREVKAIKCDFAIRAGINAGEVFCDDATPMAEMTDMVIDIAGHMQKYGCVNGVAISKRTIEPLLGEFRFTDAARLVDGLPVYEWKPEA
ncbi:MAG: hypothetical protein WCK75_04445 [Elusimicrobiota bacterium]